MVYDKLDLLGVRYDAELEYKAKYNLAKNIAEYWKENCTDTNVMSNEFYKNCINTINEELGDGAYPDEVERVWEIIEKNFIN